MSFETIAEKIRSKRRSEKQDDDGAVTYPLRVAEAGVEPARELPLTGF